ncbi:MAG: hypothetical protein R3253_12580, partial [Longimicrobiales bacterium]|nr:hypothetical protein [Longimicrobiales bacterium]
MNERHASAPEREPPETVVRRVVEPGERIVWCARPDRDALTAKARRLTSGGSIVGRLVRFGVVGVAMLLGASYLNGSDPRSTLELFSTAIRSQPLQALMAVTALVGFSALIFWLNRRSAQKFVERADRLVYAITDRRLLILVGDEIEREFSPEEVRSPQVEPRVDGFGDVILRKARAPRNRGGESVSAREHRSVGFKALPDADEILHLIEQWRDAHLTASERQVEDFLSEHASPSLSRQEGGDSMGVEAGASRHGGEATGAPQAGATPALDDDEQRITGGQYDLEVTAPAEWEVEVRKRGQPFGKVALDVVRWTHPSVLEGWNAVKVDGPFATEVEVHVDAVATPTMEYQRIVNSTLGGMMAGQVVESQPDLQRGRFRGWSVTRRHESMADASRPELDQPGFTRTTLLHDGVIQLVFQSRWPAGTESLARVVDMIEEKVSVRSEGVKPVAPRPNPLAGVLGVFGAVVTLARVVFGLFIFGIGVWAGYDQTQRAQGYDSAVGRLVAASDQGFPTLSPRNVVDEHDGRLAYLQAPLEVPTVTDTLTGVSVDTWRLVRTVEVASSADGAASGGSSTAPRPYDEEIFISEDLRMGAWRLPPLTWGTPQREPVPDSVLEAA